MRVAVRAPIGENTNFTDVFRHSQGMFRAVAASLISNGNICSKHGDFYKSA